MTLGIAGTGPYGRIRSLRRQIEDCRYEKNLSVGKAKINRLNAEIESYRAEIKQILAREKATKVE